MLSFSTFAILKNKRRGVRVAERACLESMYTRKGIAGSNPALSADELNEAPLFSGVFNFWEIPKALLLRIYIKIENSEVLHLILTMGEEGP